MLWQVRRGSAPLVPMAYARASGILAVAEYGGSGRLHLYRPPSTRPERTLEDFRGRFTQEFTRMAVISPDGTRLAYPGRATRCTSSSPASGELRGRLTGLIWHVGALALSPDNGRLAAGSSDGSLMVWDLASGKPDLGPFPAHAAAVNHVEYSSDGKGGLTTAGAGGLRLWNAANGRSMISIPEAESTAAPLLAAGDQAVVFWNLRTADIERHPAPPLSHFDRPRR